MEKMVKDSAVMRKNGSIYYFAGLLFMVVSAVFLANVFLNPGYLGNFILKTQPDGVSRAEAEKNRREVEENYGVSFVYPKRTPDSVNLYIPEYDFIDEEQAELYMNFFGIGEWSMKEEGDEAFYHFAGSGGEVKINKYYNRIIAKYFVEKGTNAEVFSSELNEGAEELALDYLVRRLLPVNYSESSVAGQNGQYAVVFYSKLDGLINRSHPVTVYLDESGNVTGMDYFQLIYEPLTAVKIISMKEAYYRLPHPETIAEYAYLGSDLRVDISKCALIYRFEDSIMQPAYLFEGEIIDRGSGNTAAFTYYVSAPKFN